jgi:hypothetical protein
MSSTSSLASSGREAAIARRLALSAGKSALPPAAERVRNGVRSSALPTAGANGRAAAPVAHHEHAPPAVASSVGPAAAAAEPAPHASSAPVQTASTLHSTNPSMTGRLLSMSRRRQQVTGKTGLAAARAAAPTAATAEAHDIKAAPAAHECAPDCDGGPSCRGQARARRAQLSLRGRGDAPPARPSRVARKGTIEHAPKVVVSTTHGAQSVTGIRIGNGRQMTGDEAGARLPVSGTQYIGAESGGAMRPSGPKVGISRTGQGVLVSGTLVRSKVAVTGDEAGSAVKITGEADQGLDDDLTERNAASGVSSAQFQRQTDPHGHSVFGTNLARSSGSVGSRVRERAAALESTQSGVSITGSAVGRSVRVTGDEDGSCHSITGNQYLTPARAQAECGAGGGGTAEKAHIGASRRDPVTGNKVSVAQTWGRQRVTGTNVEYSPKTTGDAAGSCATITGTPYHGPETVEGWCDPALANAAAQRLPRQASAAAVTGDTPFHADGVTGTERGAGRDITGTPYFRDKGAASAPELADIAARFSVRSPQRSAQARAAEAAAAEAAAPQRRITGSFAIGQEKVTGNLEFLFTPRRPAGADAKPAHARISGEGRSTGQRISGESWTDRQNVTGIGGETSVERNPSERAGERQVFSGAAHFKAKAKQEDRKQLVTGMFGWTSKTAAKVTLSGGAQG